MPGINKHSDSAPTPPPHRHKKYIPLNCFALVINFNLPAAKFGGSQNFPRTYPNSFLAAWENIERPATSYEVSSPDISFIKGLNEISMKSEPVMAATCSRATFMLDSGHVSLVCGPGPPFNFLANVVFSVPFSKPKSGKPAAHVKHICLEGCLMHGLFIFSFHLFLCFGIFSLPEVLHLLSLPEKKESQGETALKMLVSRAASGKPQGGVCASFRPARTIFFQLCKFRPTSPVMTSLRLPAASNFAAQSSGILR